MTSSSLGAGESLLHDVILNGRAVIAAPKQYFRKPRCHGLKNLEDEARAISTEAKKGLWNETDGSGGCEVSNKKGMKSNPLWFLLFCVGFSCFVLVVVAVWLLLLQHFFLSLLRFCSSEAGQPKWLYCSVTCDHVINQKSLLSTSNSANF